MLKRDSRGGDDESRCGAVQNTKSKGVDYGTQNGKRSLELKILLKHNWRYEFFLLVVYITLWACHLETYTLTTTLILPLYCVRHLHLSKVTFAAINS